jgi:hypothetical protein
LTKRIEDLRTRLEAAREGWDLCLAELKRRDKRLEAAEEGIRTAHSWFGSVVAYADIETNHAALVGYIREWMRQYPAALAQTKETP